MRYQQGRARFRQRQAPTIAGNGDETDIARICMRTDLIEQAANADTAPALGAVKATRTIERCLQFITRCYQFVIGEVARIGDSTAGGEPPALRVKRARR